MKTSHKKGLFGLGQGGFGKVVSPAQTDFFSMFGFFDTDLVGTGFQMNGLFGRIFGLVDNDGYSGLDGIGSRKDDIKGARTDGGF